MKQDHMLEKTVSWTSHNNWHKYSTRFSECPLEDVEYYFVDWWYIVCLLVFFFCGFLLFFLFLVIVALICPCSRLKLQVILSVITCFLVHFNGKCKQAHLSLWLVSDSLNLLSVSSSLLLMLLIISCTYITEHINSVDVPDVLCI